jgi:aspartate ammonia-lyase
MDNRKITYRIEKDSIGELQIPVDAYYGINTARAAANFAVCDRKTNINLINALILVKKAAAMAHRKVKHMPDNVVEAIITSCDELLTGKMSDQFIVNAFQGGAGTSTNMNVNEVIANRAIELLGGEKGDYAVVHPLNHVNCCQSTNDVYPTALRIAAIKLLRPLSDSFAELQEALQQKEHEFANIIKLGRTELMDALPIMAGQEFGAYARAISRDRWRLYKVEERLREINIGGTAIGTGMNASQKYIYLVTDLLQELTGLGVARSEYPIDGTQNMDVFVEVSGLLKAAATNLMKISNDIRLLASGPAGGIGELKLEPLQAGSSIMPGKVNPVMPEMIAQVSMRIVANDCAITSAAMGGQLELNAFMPLISESLLESLELLNNAVNLFTDKCIKTIQADEKTCLQHVELSSAMATALVHHIGYEKAADVAKKAQKQSKSIKQVLSEDKILEHELVNTILNPFELTKPGIPGKS